MATRSDPILRAKNPDRVYYAEGVMLSAEDFVAEQTYHRGRLARSLRHLGGFGTIAGLNVSIVGAGPGHPEETVEVTAGLAIDRAGRVIEVPRKACLRLQRWFDDPELTATLTPAFKPGGDLEGNMVADVFVAFHECERGRTPAFASGPYDALDATTPSRVRDAYELKLILRQEDAPPVPKDPFENVKSAAAGGTVKDLQDALLAVDFENPPTPVECVAKQDQTSVLLARLTLPVQRDSLAARPTRRAGATWNNYVRPFAYPAHLLARWNGL